MELNLGVILGKLAAAPEIRSFDGDVTLVRYLVTTRSETPRRRIDVIPVVLWDADEKATALERGDGIWVAGSVQRRFWSDDQNRRSRIEIVARHVEKRENEESDDPDPVPRWMVEQTTRV